MLYLAGRNVSRRPGQSFVTFAIIALAIALCVTGAVLFASLFKGITLASERLGADIIVLPAEVGVSAQETLFTAEPANIYVPANTLERVAETPGVERVTPQFFTQTLNESCCTVLGVTRIVGIDPGSDFVISPWIEGGSLEDIAADEIVLGCNAPEVVGDRASILGKPFTVKGRLAQTGTSVDETIFMNLETARTIASESPYLERVWKEADPFTSISAVMVKVSAGQDPQEIADAINEAHSYVRATAVSGLIRNTSSQLALFGQMFLALLLAVVSITVLALAGRFSALAKERRREIGFMRAVGFSSANVVASLTLEAIIIAAAGGIIGSCIGCAVSALLANRMHEVLALPQGGFDTAAAAGGFAFGLVLACALGAACVLVTAVRYARMDPREALQRGDL